MNNYALVLYFLSFIEKKSFRNGYIILLKNKFDGGKVKTTSIKY